LPNLSVLILLKEETNMPVKKVKKAVKKVAKKKTVKKAKKK
jgi:hypothetical protein